MNNAVKAIVHLKSIPNQGREIVFQGKKRLLLAAGALASVGAVATLVTGATFGLFSATSPTQTDTFTSGTVSLTQPANVACTIIHVVPGDSNASQCTFSVKYTGNVSAFIAADLSVASSNTTTPVAPYGGAAPSALPLYDGSAAGLGITVTDGSSTTYMSGQTVNGANLANNSGVNDLYVATDAAADNTYTFTIGYAMPLGSGNAYSGGTATISLTIHAVQTAHNGSCATAGLASCSGVSWS